MRFIQLDRITSLELGKSVSAVKCLSLSEDYLKDHFPRFPVIPGVLMVEAMFQASSWLVRATDEFVHSTVVMKEARNMKFQGFMQPGNQLLVQADIKGRDGSLTTLKVSGEIEGRTAVSGRLVVDTFDLAERRGWDPAIDRFMKQQNQITFRRLCDPFDAPLAMTGSTGSGDEG